MRLFTVSLLPAVLLAAAAALAEARAQDRPAPEGARLVVRVTEDTSGRPVAEAQVRVEPFGAGTLTDSAGRAEIALLPPGRHTLVVRRIGYRADSVRVDVAAGALVEADIALRSLPATLGRVEVRASRTTRKLEQRGFYERQERNRFGDFVDEEEVERLRERGATTVDLLRNRRGLNIQYQDGVAVIVARRGADSILLGRCVPQLYIDGVLTRIPTDDRGKALISVDHIVPIGQIAAVEVYPSGGSAPMGLGGGFQCGSIVIWTIGG